MRKLFLAFTLLSLSLNAQQLTAVVTISAKTSVTNALEKCKEAGAKTKWDSRDLEVKSDGGKITLWQIVGHINPVEVYCQIDATYKDGITTLYIKIPHNEHVLANYIKELKKITKYLKLPEMMIGEYLNVADKK